MSDEFDYGGYADYDPGVDASASDEWVPDPGLAEGHWAREKEWVDFADEFVTALRNDPRAIEQWYGDFARENGLRGLVEAAAEAAAKPGGATGSVRWASPELRAQAKQFLRNGRAA